MSNFIQDFLSYNVGTECHTNFLRWSAIAGIGIAAGFRYSVQQGRIKLTPHHYTLLLGQQGVKKTYAIDQIRDLITEVFPDHPLGSNLSSRDKIINYMSAECERAYTNEDGVSGTIYFPMTFFINEFKHFVSYNPSQMISFFVDIFDRPFFDCSTISRNTEPIVWPCLNILAAENDDWMLHQLKNGIITGGFSRRFIIVYEPEDSEKIIARPFLPDDADKIWSRMKDHLQAIHQGHHRYQWTTDAIKFYDAWYLEHKKKIHSDKAIRGFMRTKDQMLLKAAICIDLAESSPSYKITTDLIQETLSWFETFEPNLPKLYIAAGRNELAMPQQEVLETLKVHGGCIEERQFLRLVDKNLSPMEKMSVLKNLSNLGYLARVKAVLNEREGNYYLTIERYAKEKKAGTLMTALAI